MLPYQRKKIDISKLSAQEQQLFAKYGKLPTHKNIMLKVRGERKYFDSGDYALSKAGRAPPTIVGTAIPNPENIPHASPGAGHNGHQGLSVSPTSSSAMSKESSLAHQEIKGSESIDAEPKEQVPADSELEEQVLLEPETEAQDPAESDKVEQTPSD
ncbi:hypothetical protein AX14_000986 [Amanita brunnescens Koide BX004]|nr:hypothetical protein AX14_000986 [Amanita brunnescens Koide BX004]